MSKEIPVIYYHDELNDEFSTAQITPKVIDGNYNYDDSGLWGKIGHVVWYRIIVRPLAFVFLKLKFRHKVVNLESLQKAGSKGFFLYGNHTNAVADAFIPTRVCYPRDAYVIVHPNNVSMPVLGKITPCLGAIPLPDDMNAARNFINAIQTKIQQNKGVMIYPEAHIWPYYTRIRPFKDASFRYPVQFGTPVFCFTNTYVKRKHSATPRIITYVDGPFYADTTLTSKEQKKQLRDQVYNTMIERSANNNVELIKYVRAEEDKDD